MKTILINVSPYKNYEQLQYIDCCICALCVNCHIKPLIATPGDVALLKLDTRRSSRNLTANRPHPGSGSAKFLITKLKLKLILLYMGAVLYQNCCNIFSTECSKTP